ncbi:MAG: glycerol uptake facilitator protein [Verrucomicrobiales bacterium]|jgi:glycerol uptake facilitator protein
MLVFFGCGAVATSVATEAPQGLFQVAAVWGLGLTVAIYLTVAISGAHLNPVVTLAFAFFGGFPKHRLPVYWLAQFAGAFVAAAAVYGLFSGAIAAKEAELQLTRGAPGSEATAMIFGEFFPNPGGKPLANDSAQIVSTSQAFFAEFLGTGLLVLAIFGFTHRSNPGAPGALLPIALGVTLTTLICVFAPVSMAGFNPARDLAPRLFSSMAGWGSLPFSVNGHGWLSVYIIAPFLGSCTGALVAKFLFRSGKSDTERAYSSEH